VSEHEGQVVDLFASRRPFRRKRRFQGATWTPASQSADRRDGVWCPVHRKFHGYGSTALNFTVGERRPNGTFKILWTCALTGNVLQEM
jgi:hypothetical protein